MNERPSTVEEIYQDYSARYAGILVALTEEQEDFFTQCDPKLENLCLYGEPDGSWTVDQPAEEVPAELPEPCLGINFARDGMGRRDWLALVAVHSDAWLLSVAFYYGTRLDAPGRRRLFGSINSGPSLYEAVMLGLPPATAAGQNGFDLRTRPGAQARPPTAPHQQPGPAISSDTPHPAGRMATMSDINKNLQGRQAECYAERQAGNAGVVRRQMFWPDDKKWYLIQIDSVDPRSRKAQIQYTSGEIEELDLGDIVRERQMSLLPQRA